MISMCEGPREAFKRRCDAPAVCWKSGVAVAGIAGFLDRGRCVPEDTGVRAALGESLEPSVVLRCEGEHGWEMSEGGLESSTLLCRQGGNN